MARAKVVMLVLTEMRYDARVHREADALGRAGFDVVVFGLYDGVGPTTEDMGTYKVERIEVFTRDCLPGHPVFHLVKYIEFVMRACKSAISEKADIYHAHDLNALLPLYLATLMRNRPLIYDAHELWCERPGTPLISIWRWLERILIRETVLLIAPNQERLDHLVSSYTFDGPGLVVQNCPSYHPTEPSSVLLDYARQQNRQIQHVVLLQGRLGPSKIPELAIEALRYCQEGVALVFVGPIVSEYQDKLVSLAHGWNVENRTNFLPGMPHQQLLSLAAGADIGLILYKPEGLQYLYCAPNKYYEYLMAGVPMIGNDLPSLHSLIEQQGVGLVCSTTPEALGQAIDTLISKPQMRQEIRNKTLALAKDRLNWEVEQKGLLLAYQHIISEFVDRNRT